jgi:glycosyltransferase involved in cell wall biosynthesis
MKIAIVTPGGVDRSGSARVIPCLLWFIERLVQCGDEVHVFALRQERDQGQWPLLGACVHNAGGPHPLVRGARTLAELHREHRRSRFHVIHALWAVPQGVLACLAGKTLGIPVLLHFPGGDLISLPQIHYGGRSTLEGRLALRVAVAGADRIAAPSAYVVAIAQTLGIPAERMPFGVALDRWPIAVPRRRLNVAPAKLLHVGDLSPVKDQETLLMAAVHLRAREIPFVLDIVGGDRLHGKTLGRARELALEDCIRFHGFLTQRELVNYMYAADLLVVSSRHEAGPVVALEAAAAGVPTVGTHVGLLADWAPIAARTVNVGDSLGLAREIAELLSHEDERLEVAAQAQQRAVAENADITTPRIRDAYLSMLEMRKNRTATGRSVCSQ